MLFPKCVFRSSRMLSKALAVAAVSVWAWSAGPAAASDFGSEVPEQEPSAASELSSPQATEHEFRGGGYVKNFSANCADNGWTGRYYMSVRYRPPGIGANGPETRITFFFPLFLAANYILESGNLNSNYKDVLGAGMSTRPYDFTIVPQMRVTEMTPNNVTGSTNYITMKGQIKGWSDIQGCRATFEVSLTKRP